MALSLLNIEAYDGLDNITNSVSKDVTVVNKNSSISKTRSKKTFETVVLEILGDGKPRLISELIDDYYLKTNKKITSKDFSSKLSIRAKSGKRIKNIKFVDFPIEKRFWWALSEWFEGNLLKPDYTKIIHEKFNAM